MKLESVGGGDDGRRRFMCLLFRDINTSHLEGRRRRSDRTQASHLFLLRESKVPTAQNYPSQSENKN